MSALELANLTWTTVPAAPLVVIPVGSIEQHGPHLPFDTDTSIATALACAVAERMDGDVIVAPALVYGSSGEHQSFAGTSSIGSEALRVVVIELVRSMSAWAGQIIFVNAHGGNIAAISKAVFQMVVEKHQVAWVPCATEDIDLHAGIMETSLMLHIRPDSVDLSVAEPGNTGPLAEILPALVAGGVAAVSPNGILGDPTGATAADGERLLGLIVDEVMRRIRTGTVDDRGMLTGATAETMR